MERSGAGSVERGDVEMLEAMRLAASSLGVDRVTAEVTAALAAASIDSIVLKGPAIATWLYGSDRARLYGDSDLMIRRGDWSKAQEVVRGLGFEDALGGMAHPRMESGEGHPWARAADQAEVDLHCTIFGLGAEPEVIWRSFLADASLEPIGGALVRMPSHAARLVHIALHVVQHGDMRLAQPLEDLQRAVAVAPRSTWAEARDLAELLDGAAAFAAGLALTAEGRELAAELGVDAAPSVRSALRLGDVPTSEGFAELAAARGWRARLAILAREAVPNPSFMRWWSALARRGRVGLALSYPLRWAWLAYRAAPGFLAWRRAVRASAKDS